jgi:DNA-binding MarR family transcriptional regulator
VLAHPERLAIVELLLHGQASQRDLRLRLQMHSGTTSKHLGALEERRVVSRTTSHGEYDVVCPTELLRLLEAAAELGAATSRAQAEADEKRQRAVRKLKMSRGADMEQAQHRPSNRRRGDAGASFDKA